MKRILVTGASGLLGLNFCYFFHEKYDVFGVVNTARLSGLPFKTIRCNLLTNSAADLLGEAKPDIVLHCAAMANIDQCEQKPNEAQAINAIYPGLLAAQAAKRGIKFIHISTDAVFDGENCGEAGYREADPTNPISRYAETKLEGEQFVLECNTNALIARVNFYGWSVGGKRSLVEFFYNNLSEGNKVNGFSDVYFSTMYVHCLADILDELIGLDAHGIYHVFSPDWQSKYAFGVSVAEKFGFDSALVQPVSWKDGGLTAKRSPNLIMNTEKLRKTLGHDLPKQQDSLERFYQDHQNGLREKIQGFVK